MEGRSVDPSPRDLAPSKLKLGNVVFIGSVHLAALGAIVHLFLNGTTTATVVLALVWYGLCGLSITAGYHRLFSHAAYRSRPILKVFYLLFGAASFQNSALTWSADHRAHHANTDGPDDPYSVRRGFWWAHIGWVLRHGTVSESRVKDLAADPLVRFQHRYWMPLGVLAGFAVRWRSARSGGDALGAVLLAGFLRLTVQWHATFAVNSIAHIFGTQPFSTKGTARDNIITAFATMGEGYHNYHHRFPRDYRCGIRWFDYDPSKWWIRLLWIVGLAGDLKAVAPQRIATARAGVRTQEPSRRDIGILRAKDER